MVAPHVNNNSKKLTRKITHLFVTLLMEKLTDKLRTLKKKENYFTCLMSANLV